MRVPKINYRILMKFLMSYLLILLIPLLLGIFVYKQVLQLIETEIQKSNLATLEQCSRLLSARFSEIDALCLQIAGNYNVNNMLLEENPLVQGSSVFRIKETQRELAQFKYANNFIKTFYVYFQKSNVIISPDDSYIRLNYCYNTFFKYGSMNYQEWRDNFLLKGYKKKVIPATMVNFNGTPESVVTYAQTIPIDGFGKSKGDIVVYIQEKEILKYLEPLTSELDGFVYIQNDKGELITAYPPGDKKLQPLEKFSSDSTRGVAEYKISGEDMIVSYTMSHYNNWRFVAVLPYSTVMEKVRYIKFIIGWFVAVSVFFGSAAAYFMAYRNSRPIENLLSCFNGYMAQENDKFQNIYDFIINSVKRLINENVTLNNSLKKQMPILQDAVFNRILSGEFSDMGELETSLSRLGIENVKGKLVVLIMQIDIYGSSLKEDGPRTLESVKSTVAGVLKNFAGSTFYIHDIELNRIAIITGFPEGGICDYESQVEQVCRSFYDSVHLADNISLTIAVGNAVEGLVNVHHSFIQAKNALEYKMVNRNIRLIWYKDIPKVEEVYYYPPELEIHLMHCAMAAEFKSVESLLNDLYVENFTNRKLSIEMVKQLIDNMNCTIVKLNENITVKNNLQDADLIGKSDRFSGCMSIGEVFNHIKSDYMQICDIYTINKKSNNKKLRDDIIEYIDTNYMKSDLCVSIIAKIFNLSEAYLSQFFKEQTGQNFKSYVEAVRIHAACELLLCCELPVIKISQKVGYNSPQVFRSAFKRVIGINPVAYKNSKKLTTVTHTQ